jgi:hypothetical protein
MTPRKNRASGSKTPSAILTQEKHGVKSNKNDHRTVGNWGFLKNAAGKIRGRNFQVYMNGLKNRLYIAFRPLNICLRPAPFIPLSCKRSAAKGNKYEYFIHGDIFVNRIQDGVVSRRIALQDLLLTRGQKCNPFLSVSAWS